MKEKRAFLIFDESSPDYYIARVTRAQDEVTPELWNLEIGGVFMIPGEQSRGWQRVEMREA